MQNEIRQNATDTLKDYIRALAASGLSLIPIADSEKKPHPILGAKHDLLKRPPTDKELDAWLGRGITSWAVASGAVSGNLVVLDFDEKHHPGLYDRWYDKLSDDQKAVVATCPISKTRNNGKHVRYRTETPQPTTKLSRRVIKEKIETTSETRGEGAYALIPPSPGYELIQGNLLDLPLITDEMHEEFVDVLRIFNEVEDKPATEYEWVPGTVVDGDRPGDSFNKFATWEEILEPHGWVQESKDRWRRPGKKDGEGISATTNHAGVPMLYVFSSAAAPFEQNKGFSKFHAYALLEHGGDFKAAARAAAEKYPATESDGNTERYATLLESVPKNIGKENIISALKPLLEALADEKSLPEAELYIRSIIKDKCGLTSRDVDSIIKYFKEWRKPIQAKKEAERIKTEQTKTEPPPTEEERRAAEQILKSPMLLYDVLQMVKNLGVVGEEKNILLHYIIFTSRNLENPLSAT
ncbi:MAG: bifunctional DNA primase/polymerase, partial [Ktedonobacteraceae bacterium]